MPDQYDMKKWKDNPWPPQQMILKPKTEGNYERRPDLEMQLIQKRRSSEVFVLPDQYDMKKWKSIGNGSVVHWPVGDLRPIEAYDQYNLEVV